MAPVRTTVLPLSPAPTTAAVAARVSVPWVITMRFSGTAPHRSRMWHRPAPLQDVAAPRIGHLQAVDHHEGFDLHFQQAAAETEHVAGVRALEKQLAGEFVIFLVESAAGDEDADGLHSRVFCQHSALY